MADEQEDTSPSLEPPRLFGRRRKDPADPPTSATDPSDAGLAAHGYTDVGVDPSPQAAPPVEAPEERAPARTRRAVRVRRTPLEVPERLGAPLVGLAVGFVMLALVWVAFRGCDLVRGNESCGTGPGLILLVVVFALTVVAGRLLLTRLSRPEPGMTSFLAVGITSVVAILLLDGLYDSLAIVLVLPLLSAAAFAASVWVGTLQLSPDD